MPEDFKVPVTVRLYVGDALFAESTDALFWKRVLNAWETGGEGLTPALQPAAVSAPPHQQQVHASPASANGSSAMERFAAEIGVSVEVAQGAFGPTIEAPYLHLDNRSWEAFQRNMPPRGAGAVPSVVLAATALSLWFKHADLGVPKQGQAQKVLGTIHVVDKNPSRGIANCDWLTMRNGGIVLNPAQITRAMNVLRAYCLKQPVSGEAVS